MHFFEFLYTSCIKTVIITGMLIIVGAGSTFGQQKKQTAPQKDPTKATYAAPASKKDWNKALSVSVNIDERSANQGLQISKDGVLQLDVLPDTLSIKLSGKMQKGFSIVFNKDKSSFTLSMDKKDSLSVKDGTVPMLRNDDFRDGWLQLYFYKGELIQVGMNTLKDRLKVDKTNPYIKINLPADTETESAEEDKGKKVKQLLLPDLPDSMLLNMEKCILCKYVTPDCDSTHPCLAEKKSTDTLEKRDKGNADDKKASGSKNKRKRSASNNRIAKIKQRYRPVTVIDWNQDNNQQRPYLLYSDGKLKEVIDIRRRQKMQSWIIIRVSGQDSTVAKVETDGLLSSKFEPSDAQKKALDDLGKPAEGKPAGKDPQTPPADANPKGNDAEKKKIASGMKTRANEIVNFNNLQSISLSRAIDMKVSIADSTEALTKLTTIFPGLSMNFISTLNQSLDSLYKATKAIQEKDTTATIDKLYSISNDNLFLAENFGMQWKRKLIALDMALEEFNKGFAAIDFRGTEYNNALTDMKEGMKYCLQIAVADNEDDLKQSLLRVINTGADSANLDELTDYVNIAVAEYKKAIHKTSTRSVKYLYVQVPDADQFDVKLSTEKPSKEVFKYTFPVVGGFKIDVSTGPFFSGLHNSTYVPYFSKFSYAESRDTVTIVNNVPVVSEVYTGAVKDTTGYLIKTNRNKLSYGIGFFAHGYWRSGGAVNSSLTMGFVLNNDGQVFGMLGISALFANLKNRLVVTGGACIGKVKTISSSVSSYQYKREYAAFEGGQQVYLNGRNVPRFYNAPVSSEIPTYDKLKLSYFVALSFNLGSVKK